MEIPQIAVWGASGVGKTTYLAGSMLALQTFTTDWNWGIDASDSDPDLKTTVDFINSEIGALQNGRAMQPTDPGKAPEHYLFQLEQQGDWLGRRGRYFRLGLIDVAGIQTEDPDDTHEYFETLCNCQGILLMIDPTLKGNFQVSTPQRGSMTYFGLFQLLIRHLRDKHARGTRLYLPTAIVLTKMDQDEHWPYRTNAKRYLQEVFDKGTFNLIDRTLAVKKYFAVSVVGRYENPHTGQDGPNLDEKTAGLLSAKAWQPYQVLDPMFWLMDQLERDRDAELTWVRRMLRRVVREPMYKG